MSTLTQRRMLIGHVAEYILVGPYALGMSESPNSAWYEPEIRIGQYQAIGGPQETRSLYALATSPDESETNPLVRRVIWQRQKDRDRLRHGSIRALDASIEYFKVDSELLDEMGDQIGALDKALPCLPLRFQVFEWPDPHSHDGEDTIHASLGDAPPFRRWVHRNNPAAEIDLRFMESSSEELDTIWLNVWNALGKACHPNSEIEVAEFYEIGLSDYVRLLDTPLTHPGAQ